MLRSWKLDAAGNQVLPESERPHFTFKGVIRRLRKLQAKGECGLGEFPDGGYVGQVEQIPNSWGDR